MLSLVASVFSFLYFHFIVFSFPFLFVFLIYLCSCFSFSLSFLMKGKKGGRSPEVYPSVHKLHTSCMWACGLTWKYRPRRLVDLRLITWNDFSKKKNCGLSSSANTVIGGHSRSHGCLADLYVSSKLLSRAPHQNDTVMILSVNILLSCLPNEVILTWKWQTKKINGRCVGWVQGLLLGTKVRGKQLTTWSLWFHSWHKLKNTRWSLSVWDVPRSPVWRSINIEWCSNYTDSCDRWVNAGRHCGWFWHIRDPSFVEFLWRPHMCASHECIDAQMLYNSFSHRLLHLSCLRKVCLLPYNLDPHPCGPNHLSPFPFLHNQHPQLMMFPYNFPTMMLHHHAFIKNPKAGGFFSPNKNPYMFLHHEKKRTFPLEMKSFRRQLCSTELHHYCLQHPTKIFRRISSFLVRRDSITQNRTGPQKRRPFHPWQSDDPAHLISSILYRSVDHSVHWVPNLFF